MKTLVLNASINNQAYFLSKGVKVDYYFGTLPGTFPLILVASKPNENGVVVDLYSPDVMDAVRAMVRPLEYDEVVFCYRPGDYDSRLANTGGCTPGQDVWLGTQLSTVRIDGHEALYDMHEGVHRKTHKLERLGYPVNDQMDSTLINGIYMPYYKNEQPQALDGNYAHTWASMTPFISHLEEKPPIMRSNTTYNKWVFNLQLQLASLGYDIGIADGYFGQKTLAVIRIIQQSAGLTVDGIVGSATLGALIPRKK